MPITGKSNQYFTYEEKIARINEILSRLSVNDAKLIKELFLDLCTRFNIKSTELEKFINPKTEALDRRYTEGVIQDLNLNDGI